MEGQVSITLPDGGPVIIGACQETSDRLSSLPIVLQEQIVAEVAKLGRASSLSLRTCSQNWRARCCSFSNVTTILAEKLADSLPMLNSMHGLDTVTVLCSTLPAVKVNRTALFPLQARLRTLSFTSGNCVRRYSIEEMNDEEEDDRGDGMEANSKNRQESACIILEDISSFRKPWSKSLVHLHLDHCHVAGLRTGSLFSTFPFLRTLRLIFVSFFSETGAPLNTLQLTGCNSLQLLDCSGNNFTSLNVNSCDALQSLYCKQGNLKYLDVYICDNLFLIDCRCNQIRILSVNFCDCLKQLLCSGNRLHRILLPNKSMQLDLLSYTGYGTHHPPLIFGNIEVLEWRCTDRCLGAIQWGQLELLVGLWVRQLCMSVYETGFRDLKHLGCRCFSKNGKRGINLAGVYSVEFARFCNTLPSNLLGRDVMNKLTLRLLGSRQPDLRGFTALQQLHFIPDIQTYLNLSRCRMLKILQLSHASADAVTCLTTIDLSRCPLLEELCCNSFSKLTSLLLGECKHLHTLTCKGSGLWKLDVSRCPLLTNLDVSHSLRLRLIITSSASQLVMKTQGCGSLRIKSVNKGSGTVVAQNHTGVNPAANITADVTRGQTPCVGSPQSNKWRWLCWAGS